MVVRKVGKYEIGRTIGEGTFAKVKFAQNTETGESVAMKVLDRTAIIKHKMVDQIKREISIMKLVRHPHVVRLYEVLASRTKIYIILEFITGGELFDKIIHHGRLTEAEARNYFQQLIDGVDYCHSKGVYHRDLKPENLLLDSLGHIKISDFGLSAMPPEGVSILKTTCGTPNYVAPEVLSHKGYNGALADIWSCGVILYVLLAGYLPFDELDLTTLYSKVESADFSCPSWFPVGAKSLIHRILDPNPETRIRMEEIKNDEWFRKGYTPVRPIEYEDVNLDDVNAVFDDQEDDQENERHGNENAGPLMLNAFDLIILSQGLNLSSLFDRGKVQLLSRLIRQPVNVITWKSKSTISYFFAFSILLQLFKLEKKKKKKLLFVNLLLQDTVTHQTRFISQKPARVVLSSMEVVAQSMGLKTHIRNYKMRLEGLSADKAGHFSVILEVFEVAPSFFMVDIQKASGDVNEYLKFYKNFCENLEDIIWRPPHESGQSRILKTKNRKR